MVVLSGAGLSAASGIPTFRSHGGLWRGHRFEDLATPAAWRRDPARVRSFYDWRREAVLGARPNPGHHALISLQTRLGPDQVCLVTQNVDGLLQRAAAEVGLRASVVEMHGSLLQLRCARDPAHPRTRTWEPPPAGEGRQEAAQDPARPCGRCGAELRPGVVWFGEMPRHMERIGEALSSCDLFVAVGTSGVVHPAAGFVNLARRAGARCLEVNPEPTGGDFDERVQEPSEQALPRLVAEWMDV